MKQVARAPSDMNKEIDKYVIGEIAEPDAQGTGQKIFERPGFMGKQYWSEIEIEHSSKSGREVGTRIEGRAKEEMWQECGARALGIRMTSMIEISASTKQEPLRNMR